MCRLWDLSLFFRGSDQQGWPASKVNLLLVMNPAACIAGLAVQGVMERKPKTVRKRLPLRDATLLEVYTSSGPLGKQTHSSDQERNVVHSLGKTPAAPYHRGLLPALPTCALLDSEDSPLQASRLFH